MLYIMKIHMEDLFITIILKLIIFVAKFLYFFTFYYLLLFPTMVIFLLKNKLISIQSIINHLFDFAQYINAYLSLHILQYP